MEVIRVGELVLSLTYCSTRENRSCTTVALALGVGVTGEQALGCETTGE